MLRLPPMFLLMFLLMFVFMFVNNTGNIYAETLNKSRLEAWNENPKQQQLLIAPELVVSPKLIKKDINRNSLFVSGYERGSLSFPAITVARSCSVLNC